MSMYDNREEPAYGSLKAEPSYSLNPHILRWWNERHDELLSTRISLERWYWFWNITDGILEITPPDEIDTWREEDPNCKRYAWYNVLLYFAVSRADRLGFTKRIRKPKWKVCPLCNHRFIENSLPVPLVERLGIDHLDFCSPCLSQAVFHGSEKSTKIEVEDYLQDLTEFIQAIPSHAFGQAKGDLDGFDFEQREDLLKILIRKPSVTRVKELYGSWLKALIKAGDLKDGTRRTSRGTQCIAKDGHVCLSLAEKTIDDLLFDNNIDHEKEFRYPGENYRTDFYSNGIFVEYFGLMGDPKYELKVKLKKKLAKKLGIQLISIYPSDIVSGKKLMVKLSPLFENKE